MSRERSPMPRRSFLAGLASLPLIGGSVTLLGQPTAAATPVTGRAAVVLQELAAHGAPHALIRTRRP